MTTRPRRLAAHALVALTLAGCSNDAAENAGTGTDGAATADRARALKFAQCMRDNGVGEFPDPDASGGLTVDAVVNGSSLDTNGAAWKAAMGACKDLQPPGFTGRKRGAGQQDAALRFAQCMRDNGIKDFPDPIPDGPLIDTNRIPSAAGRGALSIPGFTAAQETCSAAFSDELGLERP